MANVLVEHAKIRLRVMTSGEAFEVIREAIGRLNASDKTALKKLCERF